MRTVPAAVTSASGIARKKPLFSPCDQPAIYVQVVFAFQGEMSVPGQRRRSEPGDHFRANPINGHLLRWSACRKRARSGRHQTWSNWCRTQVRQRKNPARGAVHGQPSLFQLLATVPKLADL